MNKEDLQIRLRILLSDHAGIVSPKILLPTDEDKEFQELIELANGMLFLLKFDYFHEYEDSFEKEYSIEVFSEVKLHFVEDDKEYLVNLTKSQEEQLIIKLTTR